MTKDKKELNYLVIYTFHHIIHCFVCYWTDVNDFRVSQIDVSFCASVLTMHLSFKVTIVKVSKDRLALTALIANPQLLHKTHDQEQRRHAITLKIDSFSSIHLKYILTIQKQNLLLIFTPFANS